MTKKKLVITINNGFVDAVYSDDISEVIIVDWGNDLEAEYRNTGWLKTMPKELSDAVENLGD